MGEEDRLIVAELGRPHGIRGELMGRLSGVDPDELIAIERLSLERSDGSSVSVTVEEVRQKKDGWILRIRGVRDRNEAEALRGCVLRARREDLRPPDDDEWFVADLIGLEVVTDEGETLGTLKEVLSLPANDVLVVRGSRGETLIPFIDDVVKYVDLERREMSVHLIPGLVEEEARPGTDE